jgi:hypothetical protein
MRPAAQAPGRRWPKFLAVAGIVACALGLGAWTIHRHLTPDWSENALGEDFGADHPWSGNTIRPFLLDGEDADVLLGLVRRPDTALAPTYVVVVKKPVSPPVGIGSRSGGASIDAAFKMKSGVGWSYPSCGSLSVDTSSSGSPSVRVF